MGKWLALNWEGSRGAIVAATAADVRDVMVEGESGMLAIHGDWNRPRWAPSNRRLTWPNGSLATTYSADQPDRLRGPQHHWAIVDELAAWRYPAAYDMLMMGLRLGRHPVVVIATTPRPIPLIRRLLADPACVTVSGSTYENRDNLAPAFFQGILTTYEGTTLGRQELLAELLWDVPGALWVRAMIDNNRIAVAPDGLYRIVVGVDPPATTGTCGIVVVGIRRRADEGDGDDEAIVLEDATPPAGSSPADWGAAVVGAYQRWRADLVVAEINQGGRMVEHVLRTAPGGRYLPLRTVHAARGKHTRAQPVASLYQQGRVRHLGSWPQLEDQLCSWVPGEESPDRLDALVWACTELMVLGSGQIHLVDNPFYS